MRTSEINYQAQTRQRERVSERQNDASDHEDRDDVNELTLCFSLQESSATGSILEVRT